MWGVRHLLQSRPKPQPHPQPPWLSTPRGPGLLSQHAVQALAPSLGLRMERQKQTPLGCSFSPGVSGSRAGRWVCEGRRKGAGLAVLALAWVPSLLSVTQATRWVPSPLALEPVFGWRVDTEQVGTQRSVFVPRTKPLELGQGDNSCAPHPRPSEQATGRRAGGDGGKDPPCAKALGSGGRLEDLRVSGAGQSLGGPAGRALSRRNRKVVRVHASLLAEFTPAEM